ncbi:Predicted dehydrogenase [Sanguibacter gelidistatuariae]|uniref:Predicted dehydrogenase n=1 Tax=Sanguibacter gelidistatuariae TaxID=1814289 RepID=A0A1G6HNW0_9MICO|nr:Gfo/Idh/MocA family oxidoreductase [Sanguibacter gelidistatuariae]SDB95823.1 Predicted dehydrogenase [Sanguibacter gelidistatuariae]
MTSHTDVTTASSSVPNPDQAPAVRWGILGAGGIAGAFAEAVTTATASSIVAVGSRSADKARSFADAHLGADAAASRVHSSYEALVADPDVDVVYVATPHSHHREHALLAIAAGKHVLVEKAFARNTAEATEVFEAARAAGVFVMEAMWTRFLPHIAAIREVLASGEIGDVITLTADHGQYFDIPDTHRLLNPDLAGGALLDLGVYPVSFAHDILGVPESITAVGTLTETGVDGQVSMIFDYPGRTQAVLNCTLWAATPTAATITGTKGRIEIDGAFYAPTGYRVVLRDGGTREVPRADVAGLAFEAAEVATRVHAGDTESERMSWQGTLDVLAAMDDIRRQVGVVFPGEVVA